MLTAVLVAGSAIAGFAPLARADTTSTLAPTAEAWYQPNPSCAQASGCVTPGMLPAPPPATSPYPPRSMHVGFSAGQETARSYLALPLFGIGTVVAGSLSVPLDTAQAGGNDSPETAKILVCLTSASFASADGSFDAPPTVDCSSFAVASYVAAPQPHLNADLAPLLSRLPAATGIVLLPDATSAAQTDSWRVVFSAHDRTDAAKTAPATVTLTVEDEPIGSPTDEGFVTLPSSDNPGLGGIVPAAGTAFAAPPTVFAPATGVQAPALITATPFADAPVVSATRPITVGYAYPAALLLPLAFLILVPATGRALTKRLSPVP